VKATAETIAVIGSEPVKGTAEEVDEALLDRQGIYRRKTT
jgi:hypothetical protein